MSGRTHVHICLCPTALELNGDRYGERALLYAIRVFVLGRLRGAEVEAQVGHSQGVAWAEVDGDEDAGRELLEEFWEATGGGSDPQLFAKGGA